MVRASALASRPRSLPKVSHLPPPVGPPPSAFLQAPHVPSTEWLTLWFYSSPGTSSISTYSTMRRRGVPSPT